MTAVVPAYNEADRIGAVLEALGPVVDEIIVVDDHSDDGTAEVARNHARVVVNEENRGYIQSIKRGFQEANGDIIVTLDADGEHDPRDVPRLVDPILKGEADLVMGTRDMIPRPSERLINRLTRIRVKTRDCGTGFRALRKDLAVRLRLEGYCTCGIFVLEFDALGGRIVDVPIETRSIEKSRGMAFGHILQTLIVLRWLVAGPRKPQ